ncbi:DUF2119 domain-containing protein [Methanobacterium alcaliphilum]|uniref:DUF2119 domain-containing protein n=1 Tax=Methanobacterium alcaliphilum TaxID=392018 RepID=UPI00200B0C3E|nr:DUF2119 domain-containing protein [Methanobacterium alcaliphilum]MCK9152431.1 DUF2119 domain-containing protein [Methanobacterium alcaliphilum]
MSFFKLIDKGKSPVKLFIGGVHGKEGLSTLKALKQIQTSDIEKGKLIIYNCDESRYISTLNKNYYHTKTGKEILNLIQHYQPDFYIESHCYNALNFNKLTDLQRKEKVGVPPLIELEKHVLVGSVSPHIRKSLFKRNDVCLILEMPCMYQNNLNNNHNKSKSMQIFVNTLKIIASSNTRKDLEKKMKIKYPQQVNTAINYAQEFFGDYPPF